MSTEKREIKFICDAVRFFDCFGNTYHSARIEKVSTGEVITSGSSLVYGYGEHYRQTALELMADSKWLPVKYRSKGAQKSHNIYMYERENNYPISWNVSDGLKREAVQNGTI